LPDIFSLVAVVISGVVCGITGFGFGLVAMGILVNVMPVAEATVIVSILTFLTTLLNLWTTRRDVSWREIWPIALTGLPAIALGVYLLARLNVAVLRIGVAVMILAGCAVALWSPKKALVTRAFPLGYIVGFMGGIFNGALGMGGPPIVFYTLLRGWDKSETKGLLSAYFALTNLWRIALLMTSGVGTANMLLRSLALAVPALAASFIGILIFRRMSTPAFRYATLALLVGLAVKLFVA